MSRDAERPTGQENNRSGVSNAAAIAGQSQGRYHYLKDNYAPHCAVTTLLSAGEEQAKYQGAIVQGGCGK